MSKLQLAAALAQDGYSAQLGTETLAVQLEGGKPRLRRVELGAAGVVQVQWFCTATQADYLLAFYRLRTAHGSESFTIDIIMDSSAIVEHTATFVPTTLALGEVRGGVHIWGAQLSVLPLAEDAAADLATITAYEASL